MKNHVPTTSSSFSNSLISFCSFCSSFILFFSLVTFSHFSIFDTIKCYLHPTSFISMDLKEFELRYLSYTWLAHILWLSRNEEQIAAATHKTAKWQLTKELQDTSIEELRACTTDTYTSSKKKLIQDTSSTLYKGKPISELHRTFGVWIQSDRC